MGNAATEVLDDFILMVVLNPAQQHFSNIKQHLCIDHHGSPKWDIYILPVKPDNCSFATKISPELAGG